MSDGRCYTETTPQRYPEKSGQHGGNQVEPGEVAEFLKWKEQLPFAAETCLDMRYFNSSGDKTEFHVVAVASEDTMCAVNYLR